MAFWRDTVQPLKIIIARTAHMSTWSYRVPGTNLPFSMSYHGAPCSAQPRSLSTWQVAKLRLREARSWPKVSKFQGRPLKAKSGLNLNPGFEPLPNRLRHEALSAKTPLPPAGSLFQLRHSLHLQTLGLLLPPSQKFKISSLNSTYPTQLPACSRMRTPHTHICRYVH